MPPSAKGWRASRTLRGITGRHVIEHKASVENGKIDEYRVTMEVTFILENSGTTRQPRLFQLARNGQLVDARKVERDQGFESLFPSAQTSRG